MGTWRTTVRTDYAAPGGPGYNTFHFRDDADGGLEDALQVAGDRLRLAYENLQTVMPSTTRWSWDGIWDEVREDRRVANTGWTIAGVTSATQLMPSATAIVVGWTTGTRSRSGRGRTFLSGLPQTAGTDGTPAPAFLTQVGLFGEDITDFNQTVGNGAFCVFSPTQDLSRDITGSAVRDVFAVLRSRRD